MNLAVTEAGTNEAGKRRLSFGGNFNCLLFANLGPVSRASQHCWNCFFFSPPVAINHVATIEILHCDLEAMHAQVMVAQWVLEIDS